MAGRRPRRNNPYAPAARGLPPNAQRLPPKSRMNAFLAILLLQQQTAAPASPIARVVVTPAARQVVVGDTLRLRAQPVDANGRPVSGALIRFYPAAPSFEAHIDTNGVLIAGAPGTYPVAAVATVPGTKPAVERFTVTLLPGPTARLDITPTVRRMLAGQRLTLATQAYAPTGHVREDRVNWRSSAPGVVRASDGVLTAVAPGRATVTASAGTATRTFDIEVLSADGVTVELTPASPEARTGDVIAFAARARDRAGREITGLTPTFMFSPGRGELGSDGKFVGYDAGKYQVTATFGTRSADAHVTLAPRDARRSATIVGRLPRNRFLTGEVWIHPNGNVAYLSSVLGGDVVYAIDISNPAKPTVVDSVVLNARTINDVMTTPDGNFAVMTREGAADRKNGIVIADTRDPLHPKVIADFTEGVTGGVHSAFIHKQEKYGTHVYLTNDATGEVMIVDINDPWKPKEVGRIAPRASSAARYVHDIDVQNGLLYGSWWNDGLVIVDVGNGIKGGSPSNPKIVSQFKYNLTELYRNVEKEGGPGFIRGTHTAWRHKNYVFIGDEVFGNDAAQKLFSGAPSRAYGRLQVIDVSDIENPKSVAWYEPEYGGVHNVWVAGDTLYMGAYNAGFHAFDVSGELRGDLRAQGRELVDVHTADSEGKITNAPMAWGVVVNKKDGLAYVNDLNNGLWVVRIEPKQPITP